MSEHGFYVHILTQAQRQWIEENCASAVFLNPNGSPAHQYARLEDPVDQALYTLQWGAS